jgi:hypothetical protein
MKNFIGDPDFQVLPVWEIDSVHTPLSSWLSRPSESA